MRYVPLSAKLVSNCDGVSGGLSRVSFCIVFDPHFGAVLCTSVHFLATRRVSAEVVNHLKTRGNPHFQGGAGKENRTPASSLGSSRSTIELHPRISVPGKINATARKIKAIPRGDTIRKIFLLN